MDYKIYIEGRKRTLEFFLNGKKYKVFIPANCPPDFVESIYKAKVREIQNGTN